MGSMGQCNDFFAVFAWAFWEPAGNLVVSALLNPLTAPRAARMLVAL
jgi:hypothetical protein